MIGREIKWEMGEKRKTSEILQAIYFNELISNKDLESRVERLPSPVQIGMDKIRAKSWLGKYFVDFASTSTLHGLNHMAAPRRHITERFLALFFIIGALASLILLSLTFWQRYQDEAIVIVLDHDYRNFKIKSPAIVICPLERLNETKFLEVFKKYNLEDTIEARSFFTFLSNATYSTFNETPDFNAIEPNKWLSILYDLKAEVDMQTSTNSQITWVVTERGHCIGINNYVSLYTSIDYWQNNTWTLVNSSSQIPSFGYKEREISHQIKIKSHDVTFSIYYSGDVVDYATKVYLCKRMTTISIDLMVVEVSSSSQVEKLSIRQRKCKLSEEGGLEMWPIYQANMCRLECRFKEIYKFCHCYPHFVRPTPGIPICDTTQLKCIALNWNKIALSNREAAEKCGCLDDCNSARYVEAASNTVALKPGSPPNAMIMPLVIFPTDKYKREQIFGFNDFLAAVGGAAGLFVGASVISFVEIIYFVTLRLFWYKTKTMRTSKKKLLRR